MQNENHRDRNMLTDELRNLRPPKKAKEFCRYFVEFGGLKPDGRVLDVGSGRGRMAIALTGYLSDEGNYEGFDVVPERVRMCEEYITPRFPNFRFQLAEIYNSSYNPQGKYRAENFVFPYEDSSFDFVFLNSVFTHMLPEAVENYVSEISRVLKPNGRCLITYFLLNKESQRLIEEGASDRQFHHRRGKWGGIHNVDIPERAVAYNEQFVRRLYDRHGLHLQEPIHYGSWSGRKEFLSRQDIVVATRSTSYHPRDESSMVQSIKSGIRRFGFDPPSRTDQS